MTNEENRRLEAIKNNQEKQIFDRKSIKIEPKALANTVVAFANADGGEIAIGITDKEKRIEGIDFETEKLNELLRVPFDFCIPTVKVDLEYVPCIDEKGRENHLLVMHVESSAVVHANQADEAFLRVGDKSKLLRFEERLQLLYDKGERYFEDKAVADATMEDLNMALVQEYIDKIGYSKSPEAYLRQNKGFVKTKNGVDYVSTAAILLFGNNPQAFFPRARIRFIKYDGIEEKFGTEMNVVKDVIFEGTILNMIKEAINYLQTQIREKTYLGQDGRFVTEEEYPKFVRQEMIVNAVTHRAYNITGTDIQIKMFDNRIVVESPGKLPGIVRVDNIRTTHFSRNPKIAEFLKAYDFVKEYGEGVDRMCRELENVGLSVPEYYINAFMLQTVIYNADAKKSEFASEKSEFASGKSEFASEKSEFQEIESMLAEKQYSDTTRKNILQVYSEIDENQVFSVANIIKILNCAPSTAALLMKKLREMAIVSEIRGKGKGKYIFNIDKREI